MTQAGSGDELPALNIRAFDLCTKRLYFSWNEGWRAKADFSLD
jgi:hypothetical protein